MRDDPQSRVEALTEVDQALALRPDWERAAMLKGEMLSRRVAGDAIGWYETFLAAHPDSKPVSGALAQLYVDQKRCPRRARCCSGCWTATRARRELKFGVAAVALQMKDYPTAEKLLHELKAADYGEPGAVDLYLAQVAEDTKRYDEAIEHYRAVGDGERGWQAKLRIGAMYGKRASSTKAAAGSPSCPP